ncbi:hypothetical protein Mal4_21930 [Maioricimonas rarisocia]|uniref:Tetratricopeptide repeat protein n=1 Tax=Maioricimonas rarisocia TaxID=2528026 RepID=A0A517Z5V8_9PLAN|nr:hypothetical protein [Maioricimonas rarisocia]QDU37876.1 hypothetical protein Mal4_21930 [Maioricimonas rarisocia]
MRAFVDHGPLPVPSAVCERLLWSARQAEAENRPAGARAHLHAAVAVDPSPRSSIALARFAAEHESDHNAALRSLQQAWRTAQAAQHSGWTALCCRLLEAGYRFEGDLSGARQFEQLAISAWCDTLAVDATERPVSLEILRDAAAIAAHWKSWGAAATWLDEGLQHSDIAERGEWEINLGAACLKLGRWEGGRRHLLSGYAASRREGDNAGCGHALMTLGHGYGAKQMWLRAGRAFRAASRWLERAGDIEEARRADDYHREAARQMALERSVPEWN